ncbi:MAG: DHHA1 domain-containing protein, partial [Deltaproteobacteria bacterium]
YKDRNIYALYDAFWHHGVIGIAAGRLCEKYNKPVILMTLKEDGETAVGSARSPEGVSIYDILNECDKEILSFGGHDAAAGLSVNVKNVPTFINQVEKVALRYKVELIKKIDVDLKLKLSEIDDSLWNSIRSLAPFGEGFAKPVFLSEKVNIVLNTPIKDIGRRLVFQNGQDTCGGVLWREADYDEMPEDCKIIYNVSQNIFNNKKELRLSIISILKNEKDNETEFKPEKIKIIDLRENPDRAKEYMGLKDTVVFYEGIDKELRHIGKNRFEIANAKTLVMYSIPPSLKVLKSIVNKVKPQEVVLVFADEIVIKEEFIKKAAGLIKFIISRKEGLTSYAELTGLLGQSLEVIDLVLEYFQASGIIKYESMEDNLLIREGSGNNTKHSEEYKRAVCVLIDETAAFRKYIKNSSKPLLII